MREHAPLANQAENRDQGLGPIDNRVSGGVELGVKCGVTFDVAPDYSVEEP